MDENLNQNIPQPVLDVAKNLLDNNFQAYLVGGCVRDLLLKRSSKDWDLTTDAAPEQIIEIFPHTYYENSFGTVGIVIDEAEEDAPWKVIEITPFRVESEYSDSRRPDRVEWGRTIEEDLARRDFTVNAIAINMADQTRIDPFDGLKDIHSGLIRAVRDPDERFNEDGLRVLRAIRLQAELNFALEQNTARAIERNASVLEKISAERIRDELIRILKSPRPAETLETASRLEVLKYILPELEQARGVKQPQAHKHDVYNHLLYTLQAAADKNWSWELRLAALFHDIGKPPTQRKQGNSYTFYGHDVVGAKITKKILNRLKFPKDTVSRVTTLIRWHMFFADTEEITHSAVRRMIKNVGQDNIWDLMNLRIADRVGMGRPKEEPYRFRKYQAMIEEVMSDPVSIKNLAIDGNNLIQELNLKPGPLIGNLLHALLDEVLEDPQLNNREYLLKRAQELSHMNPRQLELLGKAGKENLDQTQQAELEQIRKKYGIK